jgi:hypothetical protein
MRARDVARPTDADIAEAATEAAEPGEAVAEPYREPSSGLGGSTPDAS